MTYFAWVCHIQPANIHIYIIQDQYQIIRRYIILLQRSGNHSNFFDRGHGSWPSVTVNLKETKRTKMILGYF